MDGYVQRVATLEGAKCYPVVIMNDGHSSRFPLRPFITITTSATMLDHAETHWNTLFRDIPESMPDVRSNTSLHCQ